MKRLRRLRTSWEEPEEFELPEDEVRERERHEDDGREYADPRDFREGRE